MKAPTATRPAIGQVHIEAPPPIEVLGQEAAEDQTEGGTADGDAGVDPEGPPPLSGVGERGGEQREHRRGQEGSETSLEGPGPDQHPGGLGRSAQGRGGGEADDTDHEGPLGSDHVTDPSPEQQKAAEAQRVGGHHPLPIGIGEPQGVLGRGEGDDHDGGVQHDHKLRSSNDDENPPVSSGWPFRLDRRRSAGLEISHRNSLHPVEISPDR